MKKIIFIIPLLMLCACDTKKEHLTLECPHLRDSGYTIMNLDIYTNHAIVKIGNEQAVWEKIEETEYVRNTILAFKGATLLEKINTVELTFDTQNNIISSVGVRKNFDWGYGCNIVIPSNHQKIKKTANEECSDQIDELVNWDETTNTLQIKTTVHEHRQSQSNPNKTLTHRYVEYVDIPSSDSSKISSLWDLNNGKQVEDIDYCDVLKKLKVYIKDNNLYETKHICMDKASQYKCWWKK